MAMAMAMVVEDEEDAKKMQADLDNLNRWAKEWRMCFNASKCKVMHIGNGNREYDYHMDGVVLEKVTKEKDLGVWMHQSMKPATQCEAAAKKANMTLGRILRSFHYRKSSYLVPLYKSFVRPQLEYSVAAWSPWMQKDIDVLEKVQKRLVRSMSDKKGDDHETRLKNVGLTTLEERRRRDDQIQAFKAIKGISRVNHNEWFSMKDPTTMRPTRSNTTVTETGETTKSHVMNIPACRLDIRKNSYSVRIGSEWNGLPESLKNAKSTNEFKNLYDRHVTEKTQT